MCKEIMTHNKLMDHLNDLDEGSILWDPWNIVQKWSGRMGRSLKNPSSSQLQMHLWLVPSMARRKIHSTNLDGNNSRGQPSNKGRCSERPTKPNSTATVTNPDSSVELRCQETTIMPWHLMKHTKTATRELKQWPQR